MDGIDVTLTDAPIHGGGYRNAPRQRPLRSWIKRRAGLMVFVALPTVLASIYFVAFAADQYVSEAKFVVRDPASQSSSAFSSILQTVGMSRAQDDT